MLALLISAGMIVWLVIGAIGDKYGKAFSCHSLRWIAIGCTWIFGLVWRANLPKFDKAPRAIIGLWACSQILCLTIVIAFAPQYTAASAAERIRETQQTADGKVAIADYERNEASGNPFCKKKYVFYHQVDHKTVAVIVFDPITGDIAHTKLSQGG